MFTQQHYIEIAKVLKSSKRHTLPFVSEKVLFSMVVQDFVSLFENDSEKFDAEKFDAIYGKEEKV